MSFSGAFVFALVLYIIAYFILAYNYLYAVYVVVQIFLVVVILAAFVLITVLIITAGRLLAIISKTKKINIFSFRFSRFLIYVTLCTSPFVLQAIYYIITSVTP